MPYVYFNGGHAFRHEANDYVPADGEAILPYDASPDAIKAAFPDYIAPQSYKTISPRQIRLMLAQAGLLANVDAIIDAMEDPDRTIVRIEWEYATVFERTNPLVVQLGAALGLTPEQIDEMWEAALQL